jgi:hypothetical protein
MPLARGLFRRFIDGNNDQLDLAPLGLPLKIPFGPGSLPTESRIGSDESDRSPFYEMNSAKLWKWYYGYSGTIESHYDLLYADLVSFSSNGMHSARPNGFDVNLLKVEYLPQRWRLPPKLIQHSDAAISMFQRTGKLKRDSVTGEWENNTSLRIAEIDRDRGIVVQRANYFDQVATNLTVDWNSFSLPDGAHTLRGSVEVPRDGRLLPFAQSSLANTIGIAIMFYDRKLQKTMVRTRSANLASIPVQGWHCTVSGVLEFPKDTAHGQHDFNLLTWGAHYEIKRETNLDPSDYLLFPVALARELPRAGKPQLFFAAVLLVDETRYARSCETAAERGEYVSDDSLKDFSGNRKDLGTLRKRFTYEGWACQFLAEEFVSVNENKLMSQV